VIRGTRGGGYVAADGRRQAGGASLLRSSGLDIRAAWHHHVVVRRPSNIYAGHRPEDVPAYPFPEAALLAGVPVSTLRSWVLGRPFPSRAGQRWSLSVIHLPKGERRFLSFTNLVEVHVLAAMRRKHALELNAIRRAVRYVHDELQVEHPLANEQFKTNGVDLFVERLGKLINASREGQLGMRDVLVDSLDRVEYDRQGRAVRLFPLLKRADAPKSIVIDPRRAFGRPVLAGTSVPAADIRARFDAGDGVDELARDYDVSPELIEDALRATPQAA
jgi:uncharacterized protein (DUF433 family)